MGAERAITASGSASLQHFNDEIVVKMELVDEGKWILMGRVLLVNADGDRQWATAKLVHDANVVIDEVKAYPDFLDNLCVYLQAGFIAKGKETITLECNTYNGAAQYGSIVAFRVDDIDFQ